MLARAVQLSLSIIVRDATSELMCLCNAYSANERNIIEKIIQSGFAF